MLRSERKRLRSLTRIEEALRKEGFLRIAGVDEAGRGPLAGPVVAAACILPPDFFPEHLNDSKQLSPEMREDLYARLSNEPGVQFAVGLSSVETIDRFNILQATLSAMREAFLKLNPDYLLVDGNRLPPTDLPAQAIVEGDARCLAIAAASIFAKVTRDRMMMEYARLYPQYGFERHKGYGTEEHLIALRKYGPCPLHRKTFEPIKSMFATNDIQLQFE